MSMNPGPIEALILSDNEGLARVLELNLKTLKLAPVRDWAITRLGPGSKALPAEQHKPDLIVVALSSPHGEPLVALSGASLLGQVGRVPLLIISDRPFPAEVERMIFHLDFPFDMPHLKAQIERIYEKMGRDS